MKAMVLAGGFPQIALIQELKKRGIRVLLADYNTDPVAKPYADQFFQVSTLDVPAITELAQREQVDFLITACTDQALLTVAQVSEILGLPCYLDYRTALNVTNKSYMKQVFLSNGISTAKYVVMAQLEPEKLAGMRYPVIVKPVDCNSSKGVRKAYSLEELRPVFAEAVEFSRTGTAIVEEFIEGSEITVDVQVEDGKALVLSCAYSDKIRDDDKFVIFRTRYPIVESEEIHRQIQHTAQQIADAFDLKNTPMLIQMICDGQNVYVLEFSARTGGGVKYKLIDWVSGFDVISGVVDLTLGIKPGMKVRKPKAAYISNVFLYCFPGEFDHLDGFRELKEAGILEDYYLFKWKHAKMTGAANSGDRIAGFTIMADSLEALQKKYDRACAEISVMDSEGRDILRRDLLTPLQY